MHTFRNAFLCWYAIFFVLAFIVVRHMQDVMFFDSLGIWYTVYCAAGIALPGALIFAAFGKRLLADWSWLRR